MPRRRYTYKFYAPPGRPSGPFLPINLYNPVDKKSFKWHFLIDTGADCSLLTRFLGVKSDINFGIEGNYVRVWRHSFVFQLLHPRDDEKVVWKSKKQLIDCLEHD